MVSPFVKVQGSRYCEITNSRHMVEVDYRGWHRSRNTALVSQADICDVTGVYSLEVTSVMQYGGFSL